MDTETKQIINDAHLEAEYLSPRLDRQQTVIHCLALRVRNAEQRCRERQIIIEAQSKLIESLTRGKQQCTW